MSQSYSYRGDVRYEEGSWTTSPEIRLYAERSIDAGSLADALASALQLGDNLWFPVEITARRLD
jgi:hypothetical protein